MRACMPATKRLPVILNESSGGKERVAALILHITGAASGVIRGAAPAQTKECGVRQRCNVLAPDLQRELQRTLLECQLRVTRCSCGVQHTTRRRQGRERDKESDKGEE